tara:strand:+ start:414 stop:983 length:570 start_codon:yes stop_codon:yes gene_type:complete
MNTSAYADDLRTAINLDDYTNLVAALGNSLNDRKDRFDKSDIIEQCIDVYSNGRLSWVDEVGRDHRDTLLNVDLEFKYVNNGMFTPKKTPRKMIKVKLKNSLGASKGTNIDHPADFYMIGQQDSIAIISWDDVKPFLVAVPDGIEGHIPFEALTFLMQPTNKVQLALPNLDYKKAKAQAQRKIIEDARV